MSLDFYLYAEPLPPEPTPCPTCGHTPDNPYPTALFSGNATHNLTEMWDLAGVYDALYQSHGARAGDLVATLHAGLSRMNADPAAYRALNPSNGWGTYEGAVRFLGEVLDACRTWPDAVVDISA